MALNEIIPAPTRRPNGRRLLDVAVPIDAPAGERWVGGFGWDPDTCEIIGPISIGCDDDVTKDIAAAGDIETFKPYGLIGTDRCSTLTGDRDRQGNAQRHLERTTSHQIETELWTGALTRADEPAAADQNLWLGRDGLATDLGEQDLIDALGALEGEFARCSAGERGMVHATPEIVTAWAAFNLVRVDGGVLVTAMNSVVVPGSGYDGDLGIDAAAPAANHEWAYITSLVHVLRSPVVQFSSRIEQRVDRALNDETVIVEQAAAAIFNPCCVFAVQVDATTSGIT